MTEPELDLEAELNRLCDYYKIPKNRKPMLEFFSSATDCIGFYLDEVNEINILDGLEPEEAIKTLRHEFGHFLISLRDPNKKYIPSSRKEEKICKMMERTLIRFPHLKGTAQTSLDKFFK